MRNEQITDTEARSKIASLLSAEGHEEAARRVAKGEYASVEFSCGVWADEATVGVDENWAGCIGEGEARQPVVTYRVQVNWGSTYRSAANALTAIANYQKAVTLAAQIEALLEKFPTVVVVEKG